MYGRTIPSSARRCAAPRRRPGEIGLPGGIAIDDDHLYVLDNGNLKILVFRREDGTVAHELGVDRLYYDVVVLEGPRLMVVPGGLHAVEILDLEGRVVDGIGDPAVLPGTCAGCTLAVLPDGRVVVLDGNRPEMWEGAILEYRPPAPGR